MKSNAGMRTGNTRASVFADVDFDKGIDRFFQFFQNLVGSNVSGVDPRLPVIQFNLISQIQEKVNVVS
jgi:hypothetical protein